MFTGQSPTRHGRYGYREGISFPDAHPVTLQSTLSRAGYQTFGVGKMHVYPVRARCGFDEVLLHDGFLHTSRRLSRGPSAAIDDYVDFLRRESGDPRADYQDTGIGCNAMTARDRKSTRLNSSHVAISYAVFCLKKKNISTINIIYDEYNHPIQ